MNSNAYRLGPTCINMRPLSGPFARDRSVSLDKDGKDGKEKEKQAEGGTKKAKPKPKTQEEKQEAKIARDKRTKDIAARKQECAEGFLQYRAIVERYFFPAQLALMRWDVFTSENSLCKAFRTYGAWMAMTPRLT